VDAVSLNLEQIGETAKKISDKTKIKFHYIEWRKIIGLRNLISHEYEGINNEIVFFILTSEIPKLLIQLNYLIEDAIFIDN